MKKTYKLNRTGAEGFTLIELLVVVTIISVLAAIAAPGWLGFITRQRMNAVNSDLISTLKDAQVEAIKKRSIRRVAISPLGSAPSVRVSSVPSDGGTSTFLYDRKLGSDASKLQLEAWATDASGKWERVTAFPTGIDFDYRGNASTPTLNRVPYIIKVVPQDANSKILPKCVILTTLIGGLLSEQGDTCNTFNTFDPNL